MPGPLHHFLANDHRRLEDLLERAAADSSAIDLAAYAAFRAGLLRHISMEEKILLPDAQRRRDGEPLPIAATLRLQHGAIAALLVPTPSPDIIATLQAVLEAHNPLEEDAGALYETCEKLAGDEIDDLLERLREAPRVPVSAYSDGPKVLSALRRALARAGFDVEALPLTRTE